MLSNRFLFLLLITGILCGGCATVDFEKHFAGLQAEVSERSGAGIEWIGVSTPEADIRGEVDALLADGLSAEDATRIALIFNRRLQAVYADFGIALAEMKQAGLPSNPVAEFILRYREDSPRNLYSFETVIVQDFLDILMIPLRKRLAQTRYAQARLVVQNAVIGQIMETRTAYYRYLAAEETRELMRKTLLAAEAAFEMAWRLRYAGNISEMALLREHSRYERIKLTESHAQLAAAEARETLNQLLGLWGDFTQWKTDGRLPALPEKLPAKENVEQAAIDASIDMAVAWFAIEGAARQRGIDSIEQLIPELTVGGEFERETEIEAELGENAAGETVLRHSEGPDIWWRGPSLGVAIPIFDQGFPARARGTAEIRRAWAVFTATAIEVRTAARMARYRLEFAHRRAAYYRDVVLPVDRRLLVQAQLRYNAMFIGVFELLSIRQRELETSRNAIEALRDYWIAKAEMDQLLMGRLTPLHQSELNGMTAAAGTGGGMESGGH
jgi:outer membrane protein, heavy metal efflux system